MRHGRRSATRRQCKGNLDPAALFAPLPEIKRRVEDILRRAGNRPGYIFNLGHGILPETPVENVKAVVRMVRDFSALTRISKGQRLRTNLLGNGGR